MASNGAQKHSVVVAVGDELLRGHTLDSNTNWLAQRLYALGFPLQMEDRARQERFCRRAEIEFGMLVPGGERVVERAQWTSDLSDEEVAPAIDPRLAAQRIAEVDRAAQAKRS